MKTVFISSFHILIGRNILSTGVLEMLTGQGVRVVVLVPDYKKDYFEKNFGRDGVVIEGVKAYRFSHRLTSLFFKRLARPMAGSRTSAIRIRQKWAGEGKFFYYYFFLLPAWWFSHIPGVVWMARRLDAACAPDPHFFDVLFSKYQPDLVIAADINNENDVALIQDAKRHHIPTLGLMRSWDGPTNFLMRAVPDAIGVWNEILKREIVRYQRVGATPMHVIGIPHYDRYTKGASVSREEYFRNLGADPKKKLILYVPVADFRMPDNDIDAYVLHMLARTDATVLMRLPPAATVHIDRSAYPANVKFEESGLMFRSRGDSELTVEDDERLMNALSYCDVVVSGPGTINIDAAFFDRPNILINFFPKPKKFYESIIEYEYDHIKNILATHGVRVVKSKEELLATLTAYEKNPSLDGEGRERIRHEQCYRTDGEASRRLCDRATALLLPRGQSRGR